MKSPGLPPQYTIKVVRWFWTNLWQQMLKRLAPSNQKGEYIRPESEFRNWVKPEGPYPQRCDRYHLYVGTGCPWAHRTLVVRSLKGLEAVIPVSLVVPSADQGIWVFKTPVEGCQTLPQLYQLAKPGYRGRCTVPVLWDSQQKQIVNNESSEIIIMLNSEFNAWATKPDLDLYPPPLRDEIEQWNQKIYHSINNGVYRCGFAQTQSAYEQAVSELFSCLDQIENHLGAQGPYLCGNHLTLADVRLFTTLIRFDLVYYHLFKCNQSRIKDYPYLSKYLKNLYHLPGIAATCDLQQIKQDYYGNLFPLNPGGIIPTGPDLSWLLNWN